VKIYLNDPKTEQEKKKKKLALNEYLKVQLDESTFY